MLNVIEYPKCSAHFDCPGHEICINGNCECQRFYYLNNGECVKCPDLGNSCQFELCCADIGMVCTSTGYCMCSNGIESSITCSPQTPIYITASQIALSAALIMGMAALTMVVYRLCTKPRYLSARQRALASRTGPNADSESLSYANYLRASLTSMQIRVLTRLRDRPPTYENGPAPPTLPEAPPPYEGATEGMPLPPAYTELGVSTTGYINSTFVDPDSDSVSRCTNSDNVNSRNYSNSPINRNCDISQSTDDTCDLDKVVVETVDEKAETGEENRIPT